MESTYHKNCRGFLTIANPFQDSKTTPDYSGLSGFPADRPSIPCCTINDKISATPWPVFSPPFTQCSNPPTRPAEGMIHTRSMRNRTSASMHPIKKIRVTHASPSTTISWIMGIDTKPPPKSIRLMPEKVMKSLPRESFPRPGMFSTVEAFHFYLFLYVLRGKKSITNKPHQNGAQAPTLL